MKVARVGLVKGNISASIVARHDANMRRDKVREPREKRDLHVERKESLPVSKKLPPS